jgi:hypothetical protein
MKILQRGVCRKTNMIGSLTLSRGALITLPSLSTAEAQSSKQTASGRSVLDDLKLVDAFVLQVERLGILHYVVLETEK